MKFLAICTIVAAVATFAHAIPAQQNSNATDWIAAGGVVSEMNNTVILGGQKVIETALNDNEEVGKAIEEKVKATGDTIAVIFQQLQAGVEAKTLTDVQATDLTGQVRANMARLIGGIKDLLLLLTALAEYVIRNYFTEVFDAIEALTEALILLLLV